MASQDLQAGLLQSLLSPVQQQQSPSASDIVAAISSKNPNAAVAAMQAPQLAAQFGQQLRGMIGGITGAPKMTAQEAYSKAVRDIMNETPSAMNTSVGLTKLAQAASAIGDTGRAMQLSLAASQRKVEEAQQQKAIDSENANRGAILSHVGNLYNSIENKQIKKELSALTPMILQGQVTAKNVNDFIDPIFERNKTDKPKDGLASAVTKVFPNGVTLQAMPGGETIVKDQQGNVVTGDARKAVLDSGAQAEINIAVGKTKGQEEAKAGFKLADQYLQQADGLRTSIGLTSEALSAIDDGALTGKAAQMWPTWRAATLRLEQIQRQMGLDVVQNTTFGSLSEGELNLALETALPTDLKPADLRTWLENKKAAQLKLLDYVNNAAAYLYSGNTISQWLEEQKTLQEMTQTSEPTQITLPDGTIVTTTSSKPGQ